MIFSCYARRRDGRDLACRRAKTTLACLVSVDWHKCVGRRQIRCHLRASTQILTLVLNECTLSPIRLNVSAPTAARLTGKISQVDSRLLFGKQIVLMLRKHEGGSYTQLQRGFREFGSKSTSLLTSDQPRTSTSSAPEAVICRLLVLIRVST